MLEVDDSDLPTIPEPVPWVKVAVTGNTGVAS
jgi:hypothetical protein